MAKRPELSPLLNLPSFALLFDEIHATGLSGSPGDHEGDRRGGLLAPDHLTRDIDRVDAPCHLLERFLYRPVAPPQSRRRIEVVDEGSGEVFRFCTFKVGPVDLAEKPFDDVIDSNAGRA
jgi:hypothetical protein